MCPCYESGGELLYSTHNIHINAAMTTSLRKDNPLLSLIPTSALMYEHEHP